jgi:hypothetical protein
MIAFSIIDKVRVIFARLVVIVSKVCYGLINGVSSCMEYDGFGFIYIDSYSLVRNKQAFLVSSVYIINKVVNVTIFAEKAVRTGCVICDVRVKGKEPL